jgi:membrane protein
MAACTLCVRTARTVVVVMWNDDALIDASAMAFGLFLGSIPLLALAGSVLADMLRGDTRALAMLSHMIDLAPDEVRTLVDRNLARGSSGSMAPLFLLGTLWLGATAFQDAMTVFENALADEQRSWLRKRAIALGCVMAVLGLFAAAGWVAVAVLGGAVPRLLSLLQRVDSVFPQLLAAMAAVLIIGSLVAAFFRITVRHPSPHPIIWPGAITTVMIGILASAAFASYARVLASYAVFYGSLAAVAVFLVWLWILCVASRRGLSVLRMRPTTPPFCAPA